MLPLAVLLPSCRFVAVDTKETALALLLARAERLGLKNVGISAGRIENYSGPCDVALSLHGCGSATDHCIEVAISGKSLFIVSPCCVGKINLKGAATSGARDTEVLLQRPRSAWLRQFVSEDSYRTIAAAADRSEVGVFLAGEEITASRWCKTVVEADRAQRAAEEGYGVRVATLSGLEGYAKTDLIVGVPPLA